MSTMNPFDPELLEAVMQARLANPGLFLSFWEMDEEGVDEESEEEIQKDPKKKILWAAENDKLDVAKSLLEEDRSLVMSRDNDGYTPLHRASYNGHTEMVQLLLSNGADILAKTEDGWHPLHSAVRWNQAEVAAILLKTGADINAQTNGGLTPLHLSASEKESYDTLSLLLSQSYVDVSVRNNVGDTAEDICTRTSENCKLFEEYRKQCTSREETNHCHHQEIKEEESSKSDVAMATETEVTDNSKCEELVSCETSSQETKNISYQTVEDLESSCNLLALNTESCLNKVDSTDSMETDNVTLAAISFGRDLELKDRDSSNEIHTSSSLEEQKQIVDNDQCVDMSEEDSNTMS